MSQEKTSSLVLRSSIVAALGGLLFGFDTAVISGTTDALQKIFALSDFWLGFTVSSALIGTILGAATIQYPANRLGRKPTLALIAILYLISAIGSAFPWDWYSFIFFRFLGGIGVGGASVVSPLYTAEIAPPKKRGFLVALTQFNIVFGILLAYISNYIIVALNLGDNAWRWMFGVEAVPAFFFWVALNYNPESPRWLCSKGRFDEARALLSKLILNEKEADEELDAIKKSLESERSAGKERLFCWRYRKPIMLAIAIAAFNQLSGINTIMYYAPKVFKMAGASEQAAMFFPAIIGLTNFVFTMAALFCIDKFGRKKLMYVGSIGYITSLLFVGYMFTKYSAEFNNAIKAEEAAVVAAEQPQDVTTALVSEDEKSGEDAVLAQDAEASVEQRDAENASNATDVALADAIETPATSAETTATAKAAVPRAGILGVLVGLMVFIMAHAFGQGACIWVFISEVFPNSVRAQGNALGCFTHWILNAIIACLFPPCLAALGPAVIFYTFAGFMVLQLLWVAFVMPETKHVPLEEMMKKLGVE